MQRDEISEAGAWLAARRLKRQSLIDWPAALKPASEAEGYAIQADALARLTHAGLGPHIGWKIGVTTPQMRAHLGIDAPIAGAMVAGLRHPPNSTLHIADCCRLGIECEIAVVLHAPLGGDGPIEHDDAARAVQSVHPAIEIVDDRYGGDYVAFGVPAIIADFAFHAGFVLGDAVADWQRIDLAAVRGVTRANGRVTGEGRGADVQGHPLASLAWLANRLTALGTRLEAGQIVLTGSLPLPYWAAHGAAIEIEIERLGAIGLTLV